MVASAEGQFPLRPPRWCVFVSGRGSNLAAVLEASVADVRLVISSSDAALALAKARRAGVSTFVAPREVLPSGRRTIDWSAVDSELEKHAIDLIFLLGFMHVIPEAMVEKWSGRILNVHPSILPKFAGLNSIARSFDAKDDCGATVHEVSAVVDGGKILSQRVSVPRSQFLNGLSLTADAVETMVHIDEQRLVRETIEKWRAV